jgi:PKD repeat protein
MKSVARSRIFSLLIWVSLWTIPHLSQALPGGFIAEVVTSAPAISGTFVPNPDGHHPILLLVHKRGKVTLLENPDVDSSSRTILTLEGNLCTNGERGLQSIAVHPEFVTNRFIYLYYTKLIDGCPEGPDVGTWNVVERFTMDPITLLLDFDTREEIWRSAPLHQEIHNGGGMAFGVDGKLYITTGDSGNGLMAQPRSNVLGSIIRLNDDGSVPEDNPFTVRNGYRNTFRCADSGGLVPENAPLDAACAEVFAYGFRNPFRIAMDNNSQDKVRFAVSDVGGAYWEDLSMAGEDFAGANYGWPIMEGPCVPNSISNCPKVNSYVDPFHFYQHRSVREGGAVTGSVFVPPGLWPSRYKFLLVDFIFLEIYSLIEHPEDECRFCLPPISRFRNETFYQSIQDPDEHINSARMTDIFFGPYNNTQALYVIKFGNRDTVFRIRYTGSLNAPPVADFEFPDQSYYVNDTVLFNGSLSSDAEGDVLNYKWDFGDGSTSAEQNPAHKYLVQGEFVVTLVVTDTQGQSQQKSHSITVGDPPVAIILSPASGHVFVVGEVIQLIGVAYDHKGIRLDDTQLTWEVRKHHADHFHPFLDFTLGNNITLYEAPEPEDFLAATNSYLLIILYATDSDGLTTEIQRVVQPSLVAVEVITIPQGLTIFINHNEMVAPAQLNSWKNHELRLEAFDQPPHVFQSWSNRDSFDRKQVLTLTDSHTVIMANFCTNIGGECIVGEQCCSGLCTTGICVVTDVTTDPVATPSPHVSPSPTIFPSVFPTVPSTNNTPTMPPTSRPTQKFRPSSPSNDDVSVDDSYFDTATNILWVSVATLLFLIVCVLFGVKFFYRRNRAATQRAGSVAVAPYNAGVDDETK